MRNTHLIDEYILDVLNAWDQRLADFLDENTECNDRHGNTIRNNVRDGFLIKSKHGEFIKRTPSGELEIGKIGGITTKINASTHSFPKDWPGCAVFSGLIDFGNFCVSHNAITIGSINDGNSEFLVERDRITVGNLQAMHRTRYPALLPPSEDHTLPPLQGVSMKDLLPEVEEIQKRKPQVFFDHDTSRGDGFYERVKINGNLYMETPVKDYEKIRQALIIAGDSNPEIVTMYNAFINDGRCDVCLSSNNVLKNRSTRIIWERNEKMNSHVSRTIRLDLDPSSGVQAFDSRNIPYGADFVDTITHESSHAFQQLSSVERVDILLSRKDPRFTNHFEKEVIRGPESRSRRNRGIPERYDHFGRGFRTNGDVTSKTPIWQKQPPSR